MISTDNNVAVLLDNEEAVNLSEVESLTRLAPRPRILEETGLSESFVTDLLAKHLHSGGVLTLVELVQRLALAGPILEKILNFMKREGLVEVRAQSEANAGLRYGLTDRGRNLALEVSMRSGYLGPAPVPLAEYAKVVRAKSVHERAVTRQDVDLIFDGIVIKEELLDQLGQSMNSGRSIFIYGPAGTGKTFISQRLAHLFHDLTLIPTRYSSGTPLCACSIQCCTKRFHSRTNPKRSCSSMDTIRVSFRASGRSSW